MDSDTSEPVGVAAPERALSGTDVRHGGSIEEEFRVGLL